MSRAIARVREVSFDAKSTFPFRTLLAKLAANDPVGHHLHVVGKGDEHRLPKVEPDGSPRLGVRHLNDDDRVALDDRGAELDVAVGPDIDRLAHTASSQSGADVAVRGVPRKIKPLLKAHVPNEGARRLVWWLADQGEGALEKLAKRLNCGVITVLRFVEGEVEPGADLSYLLSLVTGHSVVTSDWRKPPAAGWNDRPAPRQYRGA